MNKTTPGGLPKPAPYPSDSRGPGSPRPFDCDGQLLYRELFYLWSYMLQEDVWDDAYDYLLSHMDDPTPFELTTAASRLIQNTGNHTQQK